MGPVTLNKNNFVNKAGIEVDVIPIKKSPCPSPIHRHKTKRARSEMSFRPSKQLDEERGSLPDLHSYKKGVIMDQIMRMSPDVFLSRGSSESLNSLLKGDDMSRSLENRHSLSTGVVVSAVVNWLHKNNSPFGSNELISQITTSEPSTDVLFQEYEQNQMPEKVLKDGDKVVVQSKGKRRKSKRKNVQRKRCTVEETPLGKVEMRVVRINP